MVRVLQIVDSMDCGGIQSFIMNVFREAKKKGVVFDFLVTVSRKCEYDEEIKNLGGKIYRVPSRREGILKNIIELRKFFLSHNYECVHLHASSPSYIEPLIMSKKFNIPKRVLHSHSSSNVNSLYHRIMSSIYRPKLKKIATDYLACSEEAAKWMYGKYIPSEDIVIIPNSIPIDDFKFDKNDRDKIRRELGIANELVIGHVGRFVHAKNHEKIVDVFFNYYSRNPESVLLLVGDGVLKKEVKEKVVRLGIEKNVIFTGIRHDIYNLLKAMDIFIMPSYYEGLPVTLVEAQASGLPCVVSDSITKEVKVSDLITYISLDSELDEWLNKINIDINFNERVEYNEKIKDTKFQVKNVLENLLKIYEVNIK